MMNKLMTITAAVALTATAVAAQDATQAGVLGDSGDATYSLQVQGTNGVVYNCRPDVVSIDGVNARQCVQAGQSGLFGEGAGVAGAGAGVLGAVVLVALISDDSSTATTTTGSP